MNEDQRLKLLEEWLKACLKTKNYIIKPASNDASFRRYFRIQYDAQTLIAMDAPPEHEDMLSFIQIAEFLFEAGINVPKVYAKNIEQGFLLITDFGNAPLLSELNEESVDKYYKLAIDELLKMQLTQVDSQLFPDYNTDKLKSELDLFPEWFLQRHLSLAVPAFINDLFDNLISSATIQPQFFVHRDYHSRNLMVTADNQLGVIDFQDAVNGPLSYDLVSLLRDCYINWPAHKIDEWLNYYQQQALKYQLIDEQDCQHLKRWFDWMGLQRHLKVLGIFCRLHYRDGKSNYLNDLPLTLQYVLQVTQQYPEFRQLHQFLIESPEIMAIQ